MARSKSGGPRTAQGPGAASPGQSPGPSRRLNDALRFHRAGRLADAERIYREILDASPRDAEALHYLGLIAHQVGQHGPAADLLRRAIGADPRRPYYHNNLGEVLRALGRLDEASAAYREALRLDPGYADACNNLGAVLLARGDVAGAESSFRRAVAITPGMAEAHMNLGNVLRAGGDIERAAGSYSAALAANPAFVEAAVNLGNALLALDRAAEALRVLDEMAGEAARHPGVRCTRGDALLRLDRAPEAEASFRAALGADPAGEDAYAGLAVALRDQGRLDEAVAIAAQGLERCPGSAVLDLLLAELHLAREDPDAACVILQARIDRAADDSAARVLLAEAERQRGRTEPAVELLRAVVDGDPANAAALGKLAAALDEAGDAAAARACHERLVELRPEDAGARNDLGAGLLAAGEFAAATAAFEQAIDLDPGFAYAYENLALARRFGAGDAEWTGRIAARLARDDLTPRFRASLEFALGKILADLGEHDEAFDHYAAGNRARRAQIRYDAHTHRARVDRLIERFDARLLARAGELGVADETPLFVLGMPRSGTTLVEQILSSHPDVHGAGERMVFNPVRRVLRERLGAYPEGIADLDAATSHELASAVLARLRGGAPDALRIVEKTPGNFLNVGLIRLLFPAARIVHCRREAMDVGLSVYFQNFAAGNEFAFDLDEIGRYHRDYARIMAHWHEAAPGAVHDLDYERLVTDPEPVVRALLAHCGLGWDDRCLSPEANARRVTTASHWQVRQRVNTASVGRWRCYAKHLEPLRAALGALAG